MRAIVYELAGMQTFILKDHCTRLYRKLSNFEYYI
ncbi:hypothetical protein MJ8_14250 [Mesorhizobium sp. J8]|nr:hypothetical protein MJ8_14250 [Mesorhizobium sp. J8]